MTRAPALLAGLLLATIAAGCGGQVKPDTAERRGESTGTIRTTAHLGGPYSPADADSDYDDEHPPLHAGFDDAPLLSRYGPLTDRTTTRTVAALVRRYYAVSLAGDGASACALLSSDLVTGLAAERNQGTSAAAACAAQLSRQLAEPEQHARLVSEDPATMRVDAVHARGNAALAVLSFRSAPESEIVLAREDGAWKIDALFGSYMT